MKVVSFRLTLQTVVAGLILPAAAYAAELGGHYHHHHHRAALAAHPSKTGLEAKVQFCSECHGKAFHGYQAYYTIPQLAGQQPQYLENQFNSIHDRVRNDPIAQRFMWPILSHVPKDLFPAIAQHISELDAAPAADGPRHLVDAGRKIFEEGVPDANVPACSACHGPDAHGQDQVPRLAGQLYPYLASELAEWQKGYRSKDPADASNENTMVPIAGALSKEQIKEVAAYLSYQK